MRCYAFGAGRSWEAICVDFDIAVSGTSRAEVESSLATGIDLYLEEAADAAPAQRRYLLDRRSPWFVRARLAFLAWVSGLRAGIGGAWKFDLRPRPPAYH